MTAERKYFLNVVSDYIKGVPSAAPDADVSFDELAKIAVSQSLSGIVYAQCRDFLPKDTEAFSKLHNGFTSSVFHYVCFSDEAAKLKAAFDGAGVSFLPFKGLELSRYHSVPELRTMGDLDILIHSDDRKKADEIMRSLGYERREAGDYVWKYRHDVTKVEVHEHMIYERLASDFDYVGYFDRAWDFAESGELSAEMQFLFLVTHTAKHILNRGSGFRPFLDFVFMLKSGELDMDIVTRELEGIGLLKFAKVSAALCSRWFDVELPLECDGLDEAFFEEATDKTFSGGLFGYSDSANNGGYIVKDMKRKGSGGFFAALAIALRRLFPKENPYPHLAVFSFLFNIKLLKPLAWIYRIFFCAFTKFKRSLKLLLYPFSKSRELEDRLSFTDAWGL